MSVDRCNKSGEQTTSYGWAVEFERYLVEVQDFRKLPIILEESIEYILD